VQVDPIRPTLKAPGAQRLKLKYEESLSNFAFNFNLRRYIPAFQHPSHSLLEDHGFKQQKYRAFHQRQGLTLVHVRAKLEQLQDTFMS
jgi:hypothetical protein